MFQTIWILYMSMPGNARCKLCLGIEHGRHAYTLHTIPRHDYCGVLEDIELWWPKLRPGGIMAGELYRRLCSHADQTCGQVSVQITSRNSLAGHDYLSAAEMRPHKQEW